MVLVQRMKEEGSVKKTQMLVGVGGEGKIQESWMVLGIPDLEGCYMVEVMKE